MSIGTVWRGLSPGRRASLLALVSFLFWSGFALWRVRHPFGDLSQGQWSDHFSHLNAARLFPRVGVGIWLHPLATRFTPLSPEERRALPPDLAVPDTFRVAQVYRVPGWRPDKPMVQSWSSIPRLYPPGDMLLVAPVALAYHFTDLSFRGANRALIVLFLAYAHVTVGLLLWLAFSEPAFAPSTRWLLGLIAYSQVVYWALEGFYDSGVLAPLLLAPALLGRKRGLAALLAYCGAAALHFRAYFLAPWAVLAAWLALGRRPWRRSDWAAAAGAGLLSATSLVPFALVWPAIRTLPPHGGVDSPAKLGALVVLVALTAAVLAHARAWLDLAVVLWVGIMAYSMTAAYPWYGLFLLPWLLSPVVGTASGRAGLVGDARAVAAMGISAVAFANPLIPGWPLLAAVFG